MFQYITAKVKKPENLPFSTEPRGKKTAQLFRAQVNVMPRCLQVSGPYVVVSGTLNGYDTHHKKTTLICTLSKPLILKRLFIHAGGSQYMIHILYVKLTQDGQTLLHRNGQHMITDASGRRPAHFAIDTNNVHVKPSKVQLDIKLSIRSGFANLALPVSYRLAASPSTTSMLSDDYVSIDFTPVPDNLFLGIDNSPAV